MDKTSQLSGPRQANGATHGTQLPSLHQQQQQQQQNQSQQQAQHHQSHQAISRAWSSHTHQASNGSNTTLLNTEMRAQARREREATREKSKEMLQSGQPGRERSCSVVSNQQQGGEKKISPKGFTKATSTAGHAPRPTLSRHAHKTSTGVATIEQSQQQRLSTRPPLQQAQTVSLDRRGFEELTAQRQPFGDLVSRIPSPPKGDETRDYDSMQTAYFVKYYYDTVEKCHSWQRYASNLKAKAETYELENRILKDINEKQDRDIRALEMEISALKQTNMVHEHERRRAESKLSSYSQRLSPSNSSGELSNRYLRQANSKPTLQGEISMEPISVPSPPTSTRVIEGGNGHLCVGIHPPYCSSNLNLPGSDEGDLTRPPTPTSAISLPPSLQAVLQGHETADDDNLYLENVHRRLGSCNLNEVIIQQGSNQEQTSGLSYEEDPSNRTQRQLLRSSPSYHAHLTASNTFPPADVTPSAALTMQALAAMNRQIEDHSLHPSNSVPQLPSQIWDRPLSSPKRVAKRQISAGEAVLQARNLEGHLSGELKKENSIKHLNLPGYNDEEAALSNSSKSCLRVGSTVEGEEDNKESQVMTRGGSSLSDAATVTGDYLQDIVEQKRRLRKVSQSQQQQLHYLQARIHLNSNASQGSAHSTMGGCNSRPSSRLSNYGSRGKTRSRAGSYTLHDAIPVAKDDVFGSSDALPIAPIKRAGTMPLSLVDVNAQHVQAGQASVANWMSSEASIAHKSRQAISQDNKPTAFPEYTQEQVSDIVDTDPKGAHRRLYRRLRDELETSELVRFERYVHRYDALEIGVEGSRGIVNRVRRLLLPEELVQAKLSFPEKYRLRKELAREFERIVRQDLPKEGNTQEDMTPLDVSYQDENCQ